MSDPAFHLLDESESWPLARWWPQAAGLTVGILCTALVVHTPEALLSPDALRRLALRCTLPVFAAAAVTVYAACRFVAAGTRRESARTAAGLACAAAWFPPLALLLRQNSPAGAAVAIVLAVVAVRALPACRAPGNEAGSILAPSVVTGVALELGALGVMAGNWRAAAALFAAAAGLLAWMLSGNALWPARRRGRTALRMAAAGALALVFAAGALSPYLQRGYGTGRFAAYLRALFMGAAHAGEEETEDAERALERHARGQLAEDSFVIGDVYPAVLLRPNVEPYAVLVSPLMAAEGALFSGRAPRRLGIPFSGYYTFQRVTVLPPKKFHVTRGDPAVQRFRTTDGSALVMTAHQDFGQPIDLACCRTIALEMRIGEAPRWARVSLYLHDTRAPDQPELMLGPEPLEATTRFRVPQARALRAFDRATIRLSARPFDQSARVAIRRFLLIR